MFTREVTLYILKLFFIYRNFKISYIKLLNFPGLNIFTTHTFFKNKIHEKFSLVLGLKFAFCKKSFLSQNSGSIRKKIPDFLQDI